MKRRLRAWAPPAPWLVLSGERAWCPRPVVETIVGAGSVVLLVRI